MNETRALRPIDPVGRLSVSDTVFAELHRQILSLDLPPGAKLSEVEVAKALGVSRQPVRDAFYRLSKLGFLLIRPQRATVVSLISEAAVMEARFIRAAIEAETVRLACGRLGPSGRGELRAIIAAQEAAVERNDRAGFHDLDDRFHEAICRHAGAGFVWEVIREKKAHMDRVRFLSLAFALRDAFSDHLRILEALDREDEAGAVAEMRAHLSRIIVQIGRIRAENVACFEQGPGEG